MLVGPELDIGVPFIFPISVRGVKMFKNMQINFDGSNDESIIINVNDIFEHGKVFICTCAS